MSEEEIEQYWNNIEEKADSVIETLKGISFQEVKQILTKVNSKIEDKIKKTTI
jgi:hypothetical protein